MFFQRILHDLNVQVFVNHKKFSLLLSKDGIFLTALEKKKTKNVAKKL